MVFGITGATGLIGGRLLEKTLTQGFAVRALCRRDAPQLAGRGAALFAGSLNNLESLIGFAQGCDVVVHCAAVTSRAGSARAYREANLDGVRNVLSACREAGVTRIVHVSTPSVLIDGSHQLNVSEDHPVPLVPIGLYAQTKLEAERLVRSEDGIEWVIVRPKAVFGPGDRTLLPELLDRIARGRLLRVGTDRVWVGLTHAANVADALLAAATVSGIGGKIYHVDNGESLDLWALIEALRSAAGSTAVLRSLPYRTCWSMARFADRVAAVRGGWTGAQQYRVALLGRSQTLDCAAARRDLGYEPQIGLRQGLAETLVGAPWDSADFQSAIQVRTET